MAARDPVTGESFEAKQAFWHGGELQCLGAGVRIKKLLMVSVKVYAVALYVDAGAAKAAAGSQLQDAAAAAALLQGGGFTQVLQMRLVRGVTGKQFTDALNEALRPHMKGEEAALEEFAAFLADKRLDKGAEVSLLRRADGALEVCLRPPSDTAPYSGQKPGVSITSLALGKALMQIYAGDKPVSPDARKAWLAALPPLVAS